MKKFPLYFIPVLLGKKMLKHRHVIFIMYFLKVYKDEVYEHAFYM